VKFELIGM